MNTDKIYAESIAKEYAPKDHSKIVALRKLDSKAKTPAAVFAYTFGIFSCLLGFACCGINYPIYQKLLKKGKEKYAYEIIELAREISEQ